MLKAIVSVDARAWCAKEYINTEPGMVATS